MYISRRAFLKSCGAVVAGAICAAGLPACTAAPDPEPEPEPEPPAPTRLSIARDIIDVMPIEAKVAQLFVVKPEHIFGSGFANRADGLTAERLGAIPVCGITFFGNHLNNTPQTKDMLAGLRTQVADAGIIPLLLCVDEEGGFVQRIGSNPAFSVPYIDHAANIGATGSVEAARSAAASIADRLLYLGFNTDFAPSCDISSGPGSAMHKRSFSTDASVVANMAVAQIEEFEARGVMCCAKHFPGIGEPTGDSHDTAIVTQKGREELEGQLLPFRMAIEAGVPLVMVSHLSAPTVTGTGAPSSLSPAIVQDLLRGELGYEGVVITDSLGMGAVTSFVAPQEVAVMAIEAGCDIVLMPVDFEAAYYGLLGAVQEGRIGEERIDESLERIITTKLAAMPELFDTSVQGQLALVES